jgi:hypothetical protein
LHPDRETDASQRAAKTALMQRVNQAYAANDLLELQLQVEQIDASHIANAGAARLKHYNQVLGDQLAELRMEIERVETTWRMEFGVNPMALVHPRQLNAFLAQTASQWRAALVQRKRDTRMLADVPAIKRWLRQQKRSRS